MATTDDKPAKAKKKKQPTQTDPRGTPTRIHKAAGGTVMGWTPHTKGKEVTEEK